jgi:sugar phosphate isomerase/epimerase
MKLYVRAHDLGVKDIEPIAEKLCELGLDGIQFVGYKCLTDVKQSVGSFTALHAENVAKTLKNVNKTIPLIGAYFNPVHPNLEKREAGVALFCEYLGYAKTLGASYVGSETGSCLGEPWAYHPDNRTESSYSTVVETFQALADYAKEQGVSIAMEGAFGHVAYNVETLNTIVKRIDRDNIKIIFDLYNYLAPENYERAYEILDEGLATFGDSILLFHIKDCILTEDGKLKQVAVGRGSLDFDKILSKIYKANPDALLVFEGTVGDDLPDSIKFIKEKISRIEK